MRKPAPWAFVAAGAAAVLIAAASPRAEAEPTVFKYALAMPHFNIQYVAGGMIGFVANPDPMYDRTAEETEDAIITESFEPVLDIFLAHSDWHTDIELQGYMLDVMAARHPGVLDKLRTLANAGRMDVVSFHYSDQLFLANPREDWDHSVDLNLATFQKHDIRHAKTVFCQEGQAGPGMAGAMKDKGFEVLVWPKNLFSYQYPNVEPMPIYQFGDVKMITSRGLNYKGPNAEVNVQWTFVDDGELLATMGTNPYFPFAFHKDDKSVKDYENQLIAMEAAGYKIATVAEYIKAVEG